MDDVRRRDGAAEILRDSPAEIFGLGLADGDVRRVALERLVGGADQGEILLIRDGEDDSAVIVLQNVCLSSVILTAQHDVAAFDQARPLAAGEPGAVVQHVGDPRPRGIDQGARGNLRRTPVRTSCSSAVQLARRAGPKCSACGCGCRPRARVRRRRSGRRDGRRPPSNRNTRTRAGSVPAAAALPAPGADRAGGARGRLCRPPR